MSRASSERDVSISPAPGDDERAAIHEALDAVFRREQDIARPSPWKLAGWTHRRAGLADLGRSFPDERRWPLAARLPRGGRDHVGLLGRGDAR